MDLKKILPTDGPPVEEVLKYVEKYKNEIIVIKYGGNVFIDRKIFDNFIKDLSVLNKLGLQVVVVHGGGPRIKRELSKQNIESKFVRGLRVTDEKIINVVETVLIPEQKELGFVGIPNKINIETIFEKLKNNIIPIISPLGLGENKQTYNINGDHAAGAVAKSLKSRRLLLMTNVEGVLNREKKLISEINSSKIIEMIEDKTITEGMIPKINTCLDAVKNDVTAVGIIDGRKPRSVLFELFSDKGSGTLIRK